MGWSNGLKNAALDKMTTGPCVVKRIHEMDMVAEVVFIFVDVTQGKRIMPAVTGFLDLDVDEVPQPEPPKPWSMVLSYYSRQVFMPLVDQSLDLRGKDS